jgi:hypothetical protein
MELIDRSWKFWKSGKAETMSQGQTTADFFSVADRRELLKRGVQLSERFYATWAM